MNIPSQHNPYLQTSSSSVSSPSQASIWNREIQLGSPIKLKEKVQWYQLLATLISSGLRILDALEVLEDQLGKKKLKELVKRIRQALESGQALSDCMKGEGTYFSDFEIQTIAMGEASGQLAQVLKSLERFYQQRLKLQRKVVQALSYPISVIVIAVAVLAFMLNYVVPMFQDIFARFEAKLPPVTEAVLVISAVFQEHFLLSVGIVAGIALGIWSIRRMPSVRALSANILLRIPFIGALYLKLQLAKLCYALGLMLSARVNLDQALGTAKKLVSFYPLETSLAKVEQRVVEGVAFSAAIAEHKIFPRYVQQIIKVGEQTARQGELISKLAEQLEEESQNGVNQLTQFLEPVLILFLGGIVATILIAMYLPMFELGNAVM
ncbi:MAG: type II secretion system F family protein [Bacteroidota bacterium]